MSVQFRNLPEFFCHPDRVTALCSYVLTFLDGRDIQDLIVGLSYRDGKKASSPFTRQEILNGKPSLYFKSIRAFECFRRAWGDRPCSKPMTFEFSDRGEILSAQELQRMLTTVNDRRSPILRFPAIRELKFLQPISSETLNCLKRIPPLMKLASLHIDAKPQEIMSIPNFAPHLTELYLNCATPPTSLASLSPLPLKRLNLPWCISVESFPILAQFQLESLAIASRESSFDECLQSQWDGLQELGLRGMEDTPITDMTSLTRFKQLKTLSLQTPITSEGLTALRELPLLTSLVLVNTGLSVDDLLAPFPLPALRELGIGRHQDNMTNLQMLRLVEGAPHLERLSLIATHISLSHLPKLGGLHSLALKLPRRASNISPKPEVEDALALRKMGGLKDLKVVGCSHFGLSLPQVIEGLPDLVSLQLPYCLIKDEACVSLSRLPHLRLLNLCCSNITNETVHEICRLPSLQDLDIRACPYLTLRKEDIYRQCPSLRRLKAPQPPAAPSGAVASFYNEMCSIL